MTGGRRVPTPAASAEPMPPLEPQPTSRTPETPPEDRLVLASGALDADGLVTPAAAVLRGGRLVAMGSPASIGRPEGLPIEHRPGDLLMPPLVNAHAHFDLQQVGEVSMAEGFDAWLAEIRRRRPVDAEAVRASIAAGIEASMAGGVAAVGDIAGAFGRTAAEAFTDGPLAGTSFIEVFGIGGSRGSGLEAIAELRGEIPSLGRPGSVGLSPHAPYSCAPEVYEAAAATGLPVSTHLAETPEEAAFTRHGRGPFVDLLRRLGNLAATEEPAVSGRHPVEQLGEVEPRRPWLIAHANYLVEPDEPSEAAERRAALLRGLSATVVFCPRAARMLGHPRPGREAHPWRFLRDQGVSVALGTDGRPCLDRGDRLSTLDDLRLLLRDGADPVAGIAMATVGGARGLGLDPDAVRFDTGSGAGLLAVPVGDGDAIRGLAEGDAGPTWLLPLDRAAFGPGPATGRA